MAKTQDGHIWVATRNGLATFDPGRVRLDTQPLSATIEQVVVNRQEIPLPPAAGPIPRNLDRRSKASPTPFLSSSQGSQGERAFKSAEKYLRLPPGSGERVEFHFTAISLVAADRVRFRHRLDGYDTDWSPETDLRLAFYTNLRPGDYRFRVTAANAHGVWNEKESRLNFVILPYFWQTGMFYLGVACATLALGSGAHWRRLTVQRRRQDLKHREALTMEKARIAADMHDELGSTLTRIVILGEVAKSQSGDTPQSNSTLDSISQAARDVTSRMRDLVWATNPRNDTLANLVAYLRGQAAALFENTAVHPRLDFPSSCPEASVSATFRRNVLLVMKESLHNVLKHARASEVAVQLEIVELSLSLRIRDNGCGFDASAPNRRGNGLGNMEKRIRDLGGEFSLRSAPGQGTMIEFKVPLE